MSGLTKLGLALLLVFSFSLLGVLSELLYVLWCRRRRRRLRRSSSSSGDPEIPNAGGGGASSKELLLYFLCWKNQSRIEPASSATASPAFSAAAALAAPTAAMTKMASSEAGEECDLARWHTMYFGPSRVLYTIKEEREEVESDAGMGVSGDGDGDELAETPFSTPCVSPVFYTPTSSPPRAMAEAGRDPEVPSGGEVAGSLPPVAERV
ncbi:uncharacterized protein [Elaeis guineensis]|uniref:Uncharacterized protein LOC105052136 n=1 Tax=Elaeis guineensis var. tenera TaxID=51953 RepID=A0A6I9RRA0_ELAGV|nr:uncharacterized protein LOC105052136 [Elaeis guineensis]